MLRDSPRAPQGAVLPVRQPVRPKPFMMEFSRCLKRRAEHRLRAHLSRRAVLAPPLTTVDLSPVPHRPIRPMPCGCAMCGEYGAVGFGFRLCGEVGPPEYLTMADTLRRPTNRPR